MSQIEQNPQKPMEPEVREEPFPGVTCEWYRNRQIVVYRLTVVNQTTLDGWRDVIISNLESWNKNKPYLALHDLSAPSVALQYAMMVHFDMMNIGVTDAGRERAEKIFHTYPKFLARVALSFNLSVSGQVSQVVVDRLRTGPHTIRYRTFFNRERSLEWLLEALGDQNGDSVAAASV